MVMPYMRQCDDVVAVGIIIIITLALHIVEYQTVHGFMNPSDSGVS